MQSERLYCSAELHFQVEEIQYSGLHRTYAEGIASVALLRTQGRFLRVALGGGMNGLGFTETALNGASKRCARRTSRMKDNKHSCYLLKEKDKHKELSATSVKEAEKEEVRWWRNSSSFLRSST